MDRTNRKTRLFIIFLGMLQSAFLLAAHECIRLKIWPGTDKTVMIIWYSVIILVPPAVQLIVSDDLRDRRPMWTAAAMGMLLAMFGWYTGYSILAPKNADNIIVPYAITLSLAWFISLPFIQTWLKTGGLHFPYDDLFEYSWKNTNTMLISATFTGLFWLLLLLWASLFKVVSIGFFSDLFQSRFFVYPATGLAFGLALSLAREQESLVASIRRSILNILHVLLPLVSFICLLFFVSLPFTGLRPLWETGFATTLMLVLQLCMVLFLNAAYQDGKSGAPYFPMVLWEVRAAVAVLPVYTLLCAYSLGLRVAQYGWTADRVWAALVIFITGVYTVGYTMTALKMHRPWMEGMGSVNVRVAMAMILLMALVNTPLLDPRRIAVESQRGRLLNGDVGVDEFDFNYLRFHLGRRGYHELERLGKLENHPRAEEIRLLAGAALARSDPRDGELDHLRGPEAMAAHVKFYPAEILPDPEFLSFLYEKKKEYAYARCYKSARQCLALAVELDGDNQYEYVLFIDGHTRYVFQRDPSGWRRRGFLEASGDMKVKETALSEVGRALDSGEYLPTTPLWKDLKVGGALFSIRPFNDK